MVGDDRENQIHYLTLYSEYCVRFEIVRRSSLQTHYLPARPMIAFLLAWEGSYAIILSPLAQSFKV